MLVSEKGWSPADELSVRASIDGHVITDLRFNARMWTERWEDSHHLLVEVLRTEPGQTVHQAQHAMLRCDRHSHCTRVTSWVTSWQHHWLLPCDPPA
jgi:hypothetical protein